MKKIFTLLFSVISIYSQAQKPVAKLEEKKDPLHIKETYSSLKFRSLGPAVTSGRVIDIAVNPNNKSQWYIAAAAGGVWKTDNAGTSFKPIFDGQGSYSIGCVTIDPNNENTIWVGTGENNNQRAVGYGDGIYKSEDGGKTWKNMGLKTSEHIGKISIDPNNSNIVYVAAYGPLWNAGGERGIYKSVDGGVTWKRTLFISENTGCNEVHIDLKHSNILYAAAHQRRRHEWTYISGGSESAIYKSVDFGETWVKLTNGLPKEDMGRVGLATSPINSDYIYAIIEGNEEEKGFYRSTDRGASWEKRSAHSTAGNYYTEIIADPLVLDKVYSMDTWAVYTSDGGKTFSKVGEKNKHVDNHAIWIDKENPKHMLMGCDGGLYETFDLAKTWDYKSNLSITQFYRVSVDNALPFYNVYGGTQDNNTLGGPSRTISATGITNADWFVTVGGDGFESVVDTKDPNIIYSQWQYGGLVRFDKKTGEAIDIKPQEKEGEPAYKFNWDAPLLMSNHSNTRLYFAAQKVFRSDDRGNTWKVISDDLTRKIDRNQLPVMNKVWGMDAVAKNQSTSIYGNITALSESPINENLLYAGTDDGLFNMSNDGGKTWNKTETFPDIQGNVLITNIYASQHSENIVFAVYNNHRSGDFKPYIYKSIDKGKTWSNIGKGLPERGSVYCMAEDHMNANLLFAGTEFGLFFTVDAGNHWVKLSGGLPMTCIKDIAIQKRENDLLVATFGRGFYVLDNYSVLQHISSSILNDTAYIFPIKNGLVFIPSTPYGHKGKSFQGESFFTVDNPPIGTVIDLYIKDEYKTIKEKRKDAEALKIKAGQPMFYPSADSIRLEDLEEAPYMVAYILDVSGNIIKKIKSSPKKGLNKILWNGRMELTSPVTFYKPDPDNPYESEEVGPLALPGKYQVYIEIYQNKELKYRSSTASFQMNTLNQATLTVDKEKLALFNNNLSETRRVIIGTSEYIDDMKNRLKYIKAGMLMVNNLDKRIYDEVKDIETKLSEIDILMYGDRSIARREFETLPGIVSAIEGIVGNLWATSAQQTSTYEEKLKQIENNFSKVYMKVVDLKSKLESVEMSLEKVKAPYTPGRFPVWKK